MRTMWKGYLRCSMVTIPIRLYNAVDSSTKIRFNQLHEKDHGRVGYDKSCKSCGVVLAKCLADVEAQPVRWLWYPYIPLEHLTLIYGDGDVRKSWLALAIGAAVTRGSKLGAVEAPALAAGTVLLCTTEDDPAATVRPRADGLGAELSRLFVRYGAFELRGENLRRLEASIARHQIQLVILDPVIGLMAGADVNRANSVRAVLGELDAVAKRQHCAIILVHHISKNSAGSPRHRALGSVDFTNACRSALLVGLDPHAEDKDSVLVHCKHNLSPIDPDPAWLIAPCPATNSCGWERRR